MAKKRIEFDPQTGLVMYFFTRTVEVIRSNNIFSLRINKRLRGRDENITTAIADLKSENLRHDVIVAFSAQSVTWASLKSRFPEYYVETINRRKRT